MSLLGRFHIRHATADDVQRCQQIAREHRAVLPFVSLPQLRSCVAKRELFVAMLDGEVVGFVSWHARRDGWHTIYDIAVSKSAQWLGIGRNLLYSVPTPLRLKVTQDNAQAVRFYEQAGMLRAGEETSRSGRRLYVYEMRVLYIWVQGNNRRIPDLARQAGMAYGVRHCDTPRDWPWMMDIRWEKYDWLDYMAKIRAWRPVQALVADYEDVHEQAEMIRRCYDLRAAGVLRVLVCPKFDGAVAHIPAWCTVGVSVPSSYAGFLPVLDEVRGRRVHLLGGSPAKQLAQMAHYSDAAAVVSMDGSSHQRNSEIGMFWDGAHWQRNKIARQFDHYALTVTNGAAIRRTMQHAHGIAQGKLL